MNLLDARRQLIATAYEPQATLPTEYQRVEYIESTGTQYIKVNVIPKETSKLTTTFQFTGTIGTGNRLNGTVNGTGRFAFGSAPSVSSNLVCMLGSKNLNTFIPIDLLKHTLTMQGNGYRAVDGILSKNDTVFESQASLTVFASCNNNNDSVSNYSDLRLFGYKLYEDDILVRNFIPCYRKSDGVIGLYDTVENKFYTNEGTGEFLKGEDL